MSLGFKNPACALAGRTCGAVAIVIAEDGLFAFMGRVRFRQVICAGFFDTGMPQAIWMPAVGE
jgi:hypothetical protein